MADLAVTTASFRLVRSDPEDERTFDAASGYTPALGDLVALSGAGEVDQCDATDANALVEPVGVVAAIQSIRTASGAAGPVPVVVSQKALPARLREPFSSTRPLLAQLPTQTPPRPA
jgi:hypothetical protein